MKLKRRYNKDFKAFRAFIYVLFISAMLYFLITTWVSIYVGAMAK
jgi:hypothetical protein